MGLIDDVAGTLDHAAGSTDEAVGRTFDNEPGGGIYDGLAETGDAVAGPLDEAAGYATEVSFAQAVSNALTPGGVTENPYGADSMTGRENFALDDVLNKYQDPATSGGGGGGDGADGGPLSSLPWGIIGLFLLALVAVNSAADDAVREAL